MIANLTTPKGRELINVPADLTTLQDLGFSAEQAAELVAEDQARAAAAAAKLQARHRITTQVADTTSLLGTASDGAQFVIKAHFELLLALSQAKSLEDVRAATQPHLAQAESFLSKVESGEVVLTSDLKTEDVVLEEIADRATKVSAILVPAEPEAEPTTEA